MKKFIAALTFLSLSCSQNFHAKDFNFPTEFGVEDIIQAADMSMPEVWTYDDCVKWAIANNIDIRATMLSVLQADENIGLAKDAYLPYVGFSTNQSFSNYPAPAEGTTSNSYNSSYNINASWTIWEGNARKYRLESNKLAKCNNSFTGMTL